MTKQRDLKRRIRERMRRTGESYTTARIHVLAQGSQRADRSGSPSSAPHPAHQPSDPRPSLRLRRPPPLRFVTRRRARRMPHLRFVAPLFTVVLCLVVGMTGLILVNPGEASVHAPGEGPGPAPEAPSAPAPGGPS